MKRKPEEYLALLLWEMRHLTGIDLKSLLFSFRSQVDHYVNTERLTSLLAGADGEFSSILHRASTLSGAELDGSDSEEAGALRSVFSRLKVSPTDEPKPVYWPRSPLSVDGIFPSGQTKPKPKQNDLLLALKRELHRLDQSGPKRFEEWVIALDTIFKKYLWCVPAVAGASVDVSLYDRMKVTSAVGTCLLETGMAEENPFLLLAADFSGIQNYIFSVARMGSKGVGKRLRARSFLVDAMVQGLAYELCRRMDVPQGNIMMLTGGKFYLLLPHLPDTETRLSKIRQEVESYLFQNYHGDISVNMAWTVFGDNGLLDYSATITKLAMKLRENKKRPFCTALIGEDGWQEDRFILYDQLAEKTLCPSCQRRLIDRTRQVCSECELQEVLGGKLATARQLWFSQDGGEFKLWEFSYLSFDRQSTRGSVIRAEQLNDWELGEDLLDAPMGVRLMANHLPKDGNEPLTFSDLAERAAGTKRIAVLKADVDNLGYLFADGMREQDRHYGTISRVSTLSRSMDMFFSGYIGHLLKTKYKNVYSVFAGGDDLFLIGPWDVMPQLALEINKAFRRFSGENPCVTLSAAVCAAVPKANIALLAEHSEQMLKRVKNSAPQELYPDKAGRNGVFFLGTIFSWEDMASQLEHVRQLEQMRESVDIAILRRLAQYSRMYRRFLQDHDVMGLMFEPLFHYDQARNYRKLNREKSELFLMWAEKMKKEAAQAANYKHISRDLYFAETVVTCYLNMTRKVRNDGK